jgi:hypothetical protein
VKTDAVPVLTRDAPPPSAVGVNAGSIPPEDWQGELLDWETTIDFPPAQETRVFRVRLVEVPDRAFETRSDPQD